MDALTFEVLRNSFATAVDQMAEQTLQSSSSSTRRRSSRPTSRFKSTNGSTSS
jgi:hypothetical protein